MELAEGNSKLYLFKIGHNWPLKNTTKLNSSNLIGLPEKYFLPHLLTGCRVNTMKHRTTCMWWFSPSIMQFLRIELLVVSAFYYQDPHKGFEHILLTTDYNNLLCSAEHMEHFQHGIFILFAYLNISYTCLLNTCPININQRPGQDCKTRDLDNTMN